MMTTERKEPLTRSRQNRVRLPILKRHRLEQFEWAFDKYLQGKVDAGYVSYRGKRLSQIVRR